MIRRTPALLATVVSVAVAAVVLAGCRNDGRDLREPSAPLPPTTTTSTTLPPDVGDPLDP